MAASVWEKVLEVKAKIESQLKPELRERLRQTRLLTPLSAEYCKQPFYYVSFSVDPTIEIPILSLKFLLGLLSANW